MQSGLWKQWSRSRVVCLAGIALAVVSVSMTGTRLYAESGSHGEHSCGLRLAWSAIIRPTPSWFMSSLRTLVACRSRCLRGAAEVGSATLDEDGNAKIAANSLTPGTHDIHAVFAGAVNGEDKLSSSASADAHVTADVSGVADFTVATKPTALSVKQGSTVTTIVTLGAPEQLQRLRNSFLLATHAGLRLQLCAGQCICRRNGQFAQHV